MLNVNGDFNARADKNCNCFYKVMVMVSVIHRHFHRNLV
jgi:hypothetical protein